MYSGILSLVLEMRLYIFAVLAVGLAFGVCGLLLAGKAKLSGAGIRVTGVLLGLTARDSAKLSLVLCRTLFFIACIVLPDRPMYFTAFMIILPSVAVYLLGVGLSVALVDGLFCFILFDAILLKDFVFGYVADVSYDISLFVIGVLVCVFILLMAVYSGARVLEGVLRRMDMTERRRRDGRIRNKAR